MSTVTELLLGSLSMKAAKWFKEEYEPYTAVRNTSCRI